MLLEVVTEGNDYRVRHNAEAVEGLLAHTRLLRPESGNAVPAQNLRGITGVFPITSS